MPNLFSQILTGAVKEFNLAEAEIVKDYDALVAAVPAVKVVAEAEISVLKQQASNAFAYADTELAAHYADAVSMAESAADTLVMSMTHGAAGPLVPLLNVGISQGFALLHAALNHAEAAAKGKFALPAANGELNLSHPGAAALQVAGAILEPHA